MIPPGDHTARSYRAFRRFPFALIGDVAGRAELDQCPSSAFPVDCPSWATPVDADGPATSPVLSRDGATLFVAFGSAVHALDATTGELLWTTPLDAWAGTEPAVADGYLYVSVRDGQLVVLDAASGNTEWRASTDDGNPFYPPVQPAVAGGLVFTGGIDGSVKAFDAAGCGAATCDPLWSASTGSMITGAPAVSNGRLFVGTLDGRLIAYGLP